MQQPQEGAPVRDIGLPALTARARQAILDSILEGRFNDGRMPSEHKLAKMLGVSRTTVRSALQSLQEAGVITRGRGMGTRVRPHATPSMLALHRLVDFSTLLRETGLEPSVESHATSPADIPLEIADRLKIKRDTPCHQIERLFRADGSPAIWMLLIFPRAYLTQDIDEIDIDLDWFQLGMRYGHQPTDHAIVEIDAELPDSHIAARLSLPETQPVMVLTEWHYSRESEPLAYTKIAVNQEYVRFQVLRTV